jgi:hypothetical protein
MGATPPSPHPFREPPPWRHAAREGGCIRGRDQEVEIRLQCCCTTRLRSRSQCQPTPHHTLSFKSHARTLLYSHPPILSTTPPPPHSFPTPHPSTHTRPFPLLPPTTTTTAVPNTPPFHLSAPLRSKSPARHPRPSTRICMPLLGGTRRSLRHSPSRRCCRRPRRPPFRAPTVHP